MIHGHNICSFDRILYIYLFQSKEFFTTQIELFQDNFN